MYNISMLNKIDKCFLITTIMLIFSIIFPVILIFTLIAYDIKFLFDIIFVCAVINYILIVPILFIILIITFIIKVITKNKCKKDWLIILLNLLSIILFSFILLLSHLGAMTL